MQQDLIFALHGFLGQSQDWFACQKHLQAQWFTPEMFNKTSPPIKSYEVYVDELIARYKPDGDMARKKVFIGYSLGGRLGLYILRKYSWLFDHFIFISTHPGLSSFDLRQDRQKSDAVWADLVKNEPWESFLKKWNSQTVFLKTSLEPARYEKDFDMIKLSESLKLWSLGTQDEMHEFILKHQNKVSWIVGSEDPKFIGIAEELKTKKILLEYSRIHSGHRVIFDNPKELTDVIKNIIA
ncbi:MAG: hypothetical protein A2622_03770 [Bdellovibrionales bacterium RIFCSPHIGHO2_01_FULL_40_29]|nr:MAG: hypothetical protein A2622_03770 [Bdellovibrionales bacterium RIFCSPHIGHO2_01_FULL_40_29]OFZ35365.1 MAG: hypothetical protein A3D17_08260 [Bdellovibrionales bacterium RIFCSPHIGHO2_02_FULL_40_15]